MRARRNDDYYHHLLCRRIYRPAVALRALYSQRENKPEATLVKLNSYANIGILKRAIAVNPNDFAAFDSGESAFLFGESLCSREINFDNVAQPDRSGYRHKEEDPSFTYVTASAVKEPVCLGQPHTYGPAKICSGFLTLFDHSLHNRDPR